MNFFIVANVWNIEEACKEANPHEVIFPWQNFSVNQQFAVGFLFKFLMISDNHHLFDSFRFNSRFGEIRTYFFDWITVT